MKPSGEILGAFSIILLRLDPFPTGVFYLSCNAPHRSCQSRRQHEITRQMNGVGPESRFPFPVYFKGYPHIGEESFFRVKFQETRENNGLNRQDDFPGDENDGCLAGSLLRYAIDRRMAGDRREYGRLFAGTSPYIPYVSLMFGLCFNKPNMRMI